MSMVKSQLQEHIEVFSSNAENMQDAVDHINTATSKITRKIDDFSDEFHETTEQIAQATQELTGRLQNQLTGQQQIYQPPHKRISISHMWQQPNRNCTQTMQRS
jgi:predicted  nucleic acid-binding Zn-ribbon protein